MCCETCFLITFICKLFMGDVFLLVPLCVNKRGNHFLTRFTLVYLLQNHWSFGHFYADASRTQTVYPLTTWRRAVCSLGENWRIHWRFKKCQVSSVKWSQLRKLKHAFPYSVSTRWGQRTLCTEWWSCIRVLWGARKFWRPKSPSSL